MTETSAGGRRTGGIPRGLSQTGPVLFSYGFRPFFLGGAAWAVLAMAIWLAAISGRIHIGGDYGAVAWHAHEMLFGFAPAILAGFLLTAVPNWTGRLPVSGWPLGWLFALWCLGRVAMLFPDLIGIMLAATIDFLFLPTLLFICVREIVAGRKWRDLKIVGGLLALTVANVCFHYEIVVEGAPAISSRLAVAAYVVLVLIVGGRIIPSFTRNWLNREGRTDFPVPYNSFDTATIVFSVIALASWVIAPEEVVTGGLALVAAILQAARLVRWRGWTTFREPLVTILHAAYAFVPLGFAAIGAAAFGVMDQVSAMHVLTIGTISTMMLAVMTRATRGHTGRDLTASRMTSIAYAALILCAFTRPLGALAPDFAHIAYAASALLWLAAFGLCLIEYGPMLVAKRRSAGG